MDTHNQNYWNTRAETKYIYKGEELYTMTSPVLYLKRRSLLLKDALPFLDQAKIKKICDFGCGDGWYVAYFRNRMPNKLFWGVDLSPKMIDIARRRNPEAVLEVSASGIRFQEIFDAIYCFAVLAHVNDKTAIQLLDNLSAHLASGSRLLLFEQTGRKRREGRTYCRRACATYEDWGISVGLQLEKKMTISYPLFRFYEKTILRILRLLVPGWTVQQKYINSNRSKLINRLSAFVLSRSGPGLDSLCSSIGNTLFVFSKQAEYTSQQ